MGREGNYYISDNEIDLWKSVSKSMKEKYLDRYEIIDWEKEENESLVWMGMIAEEELPFKNLILRLIQTLDFKI